MLIVPKEHVVTVADVSEELAVHILKIEKEMYSLLKDKLNCEGMTIVQNNDLGQEVKHFHVHLIPRYKDDCWKMAFRQDNLKEISEVLSKLK
jgi:histidine triad (HIT) family protein